MFFRQSSNTWTRAVFFLTSETTFCVMTAEVRKIKQAPPPHPCRRKVSPVLWVYRGCGSPLFLLCSKIKKCYIHKLSLSLLSVVDLNPHECFLYVYVFLLLSLRAFYTYFQTCGVERAWMLGFKYLCQWCQFGLNSVSCLCSKREDGWKSPFSLSAAWVMQLFSSTFMPASHKSVITYMTHWVQLPAIVTVAVVTECVLWWGTVMYWPGSRLLSLKETCYASVAEQSLQSVSVSMKHTVHGGGRRAGNSHTHTLWWLLL